MTIADFTDSESQVRARVTFDPTTQSYVLVMTDTAVGQDGTELGRTSYATRDEAVRNAALLAGTTEDLIRHAGFPTWPAFGQDWR